MNTIDKSPGQVAYEAFSPLGKWEFVDQDIRAAWEAAAQAVLSHPANMGEEVNERMRAALEQVIGVIESHEIASLDCDRRGELYCECLDSAIAQARKALEGRDA